MNNSLLFDILFLTVGLILLTISGNYLVESGVSIAKRFKMSSFLVGMTVVAFGTSAPELIVSVESAFSGAPDISLSNVVGSNIANIGLVLGLTALVFPIPVKSPSIRHDMSFLILCSSLLIFFVYTGVGIDRIEGAVLFLMLIMFVLFSFKKNKKAGISEAKAELELEKETGVKKKQKLYVCILILVASCFGLAYGADLLVKGAVGIAQSLGVSERIIGLTVVALGTSLPELSASLMAAIKKNLDISIGNIIGSNIFNILCVMGIACFLKPMPFDFKEYLPSLLIMVFFVIILIFAIFPWKKNILTFSKNKKMNNIINFKGGILGRISASIMLLLYVIYIYSLF